MKGHDNTCDVAGVLEHLLLKELPRKSMEMILINQKSGSLGLWPSPKYHLT